MHRSEHGGGHPPRIARSAVRNQSDNFARSLALILAETLREACGFPIGFPLRTALSKSAGFLRPNTRSSASFTNSDLVTPSRRDSCSTRVSNVGSNRTLMAIALLQAACNTTIL